MTFRAGRSSGRSRMADVPIAANMTLTLKQAQQVAERAVQVLEMHWRTVKAETVMDRLRSLYTENGRTLNMNAVRVWVHMNRQPITLKEAADCFNQPPLVALYFTTLASITSEIFSALDKAPEAKDVSSAMLTRNANNGCKQSVRRCADIF